MADKKLNLYEKIQAVSNKIKNIEKDMTVGKGNYSYKAVSDVAVTLAVKDAETEFKLLSVPYNQELISSETIRTVAADGKESIKFVDNIKMTVKIVDLEEPTNFMDIITFGKGVDTADKGFGKASTYARKYALLNVYKIATGEDLDANKSELTEVPETADEKMVVLDNYFAKNVGKLHAILKHFGAENLIDLSSKEVELTYTTYKEKGLIQ